MVQISRSFRRHRAQLNDPRAWSGATKNAAAAQIDVFYSGTIRKARQHNVYIGGQRSGLRRNFGSQSRQLYRLIALAVEYDHREPSRKQAAGNPRSHVSESDEA
jgi:hypothetical protein